MAGQSNEQQRIIQQLLGYRYRCRHHHHHELPKPRLHWTPQLHASFLDAIDQLGGPNCATPKNIMKLMKTEGLTRQQVKSHLQNTRLGKVKRLEKLASHVRQISQATTSIGRAPSTLNEPVFVEGNLSGAPGASFGCGNNRGSENGSESWIKMTPADIAAQLFDDFKNAPVAAEAILQQKAAEIASAMNGYEDITNAPSVYDDFWELLEHDEDDLLISHQAKKQKTVFLSSDDEHREYSLSGPSHQPPSLRSEWRWEGIMAKKGIPICRARCFPVGIVTDIKLPEVLNIVARTGLETVAEQYYHAAGAWVVFFTPESEADIGIYNDFMHGLERKQRAAVADVDAATALFLVPPSEFSEKVLKVPGTSRISGVIIRFGHKGTDAGPSSLPHPHGDIPHPPPTSSWGDFLEDFSFPGNLSAAPPPAPISDSAHAAARATAKTTNENMQDYVMLNQQNPAVLPTYSVQNVAFDAAAAGPSSMRGAAAAFQSEQLAQLAHPQMYGLQNDYQLNSGLLSSFQFDQVQPQQGSNVPQTSGAQQNDPHTLLQAALQLAAGLLQHIQKKKGN